MKKSLEIIQNNAYPIQVTSYLLPEELKSWINDFRKKKIKIDLKNKCGLFAIFREVTRGEIAEIKSGVVIIRGGSFQEVKKEGRKK